MTPITEITHPRIMKLGESEVSELVRSINAGDPGSLATAPTSRALDFLLADRLDASGTAFLREWTRTGKTATLRINSVAVLSKMNHPEDTTLIIETLENDSKVRHLSLASEVSKLTQWDWATSRRVAREPTTAPAPRELAEGLVQEAVNRMDALSRWCGAYLLLQLVPVLGESEAS